MRILIDTREQAPFTFEGYEVELKTATLPVRDYSLPGFEDRAAVERKSLDDLVGCLMGKDRERFERELVKGRAYDLFAVVVEATLARCVQRALSVRHDPTGGLTDHHHLSGEVSNPLYLGRKPGRGGVCYLFNAAKISPGDRRAVSNGG